MSGGKIQGFSDGIFRGKGICLGQNVWEELFQGMSGGFSGDFPAGLSRQNGNVWGVVDTQRHRALLTSYTISSAS